MAFTTRKNTPAISTAGTNTAQYQPLDPKDQTQTQHQGGIRGKLDAMHSQAHESVKAQRNVTHKAGK